MNNYDELIAVISALSEKSFFDYLISIGPIVLSIVAIFISIYTTAKQNKIALFDKRCYVLEIIKRIILFSELVDPAENRYISDEKQFGKPYALTQKSYITCETYNSIFGTNFDYKKIDEEKFSLFTSLYAIEKNLMMAEYLFYPGINALLSEIHDTMSDYIINAMFQEDSSSYKKQFREKCLEFNTKWLPKLEKKTRI